jgi:uncharacterized protein YndB with AHSA1/START domain
MSHAEAIDVARRYHAAWTNKRYEEATDLLSTHVLVEVPINDYPTKSSFAGALRGFGDLVTDTELLAEMSDGNEAMLLYDLHALQVGSLRVVEHFTVSAGEIVRLRQIHDTAPIRAWLDAGEPMKPPGESVDSDLVREFEVDVPPERVFDALTTLDGLAGWWTTLLAGDPAAGGQVEFRFRGMDEKIVMRVDEASRPTRVGWTCLAHSGHPEWEGTTIAFELLRLNGLTCLRFRHAGLTVDLDCYKVCKAGWDRFLASLLDYAATGHGRPF